MQTTVTLTDTAIDYLQKAIEQERGIGLRLSIKKTGCSGYSYAPSIANENKESDAVFQANDKIKILLDKSWLHLLNGVHIDYIEENKSGLKQKKLVFSNPNESGRCGCGESFHIE